VLVLAALFALAACSDVEPLPRESPELAQATVRPTNTPECFLKASLGEVDCESFEGFPPAEYTALNVSNMLRDSLPSLQDAVLVDVWASCIGYCRIPQDPNRQSFPVVTGWLYIYRAGNRMLTVSTLASGVVDIDETPLDAFYHESPAIEGWTIDSDGVVDILERFRLPMRDDGGIFRLHMWPINGIDRPAWTVPYDLGDRRVFLVEASTGQILCPINEENKYEECVLPSAKPTPTGFRLATATPPMLAYEVKVHIAPPYYRGEVPFTFLAVFDPQQDMIVVAHVFSEWTTTFGYADEALRVSGIATSAITEDPNSRQILAMAELDEMVPGEGIWIQETHFTGGHLSFQARSFFSLALGEKENEEVIEGVKETDYYFYWPVGHWP
jgi:hypothetical protein